jgi:hypothetical protein
MRRGNPRRDVSRQITWLARIIRPYKNHVYDDNNRDEEEGGGGSIRIEYLSTAGDFGNIRINLENG